MPFSELIAIQRIKLIIVTILYKKLREDNLVLLLQMLMHITKLDVKNNMRLIKFIYQSDDKYGGKIISLFSYQINELMYNCKNKKLQQNVQKHKKVYYQNKQTQNILTKQAPKHKKIYIKNKVINAPIQTFFSLINYLNSLSFILLTNSYLQVLLHTYQSIYTSKHQHIGFLAL
ncbi:hypothetical protein ABPG74_017128 [Tetrahymena malaccensis]